MNDGQPNTSELVEHNDHLMKNHHRMEVQVKEGKFSRCKILPYVSAESLRFGVNDHLPLLVCIINIRGRFDFKAQLKVPKKQAGSGKEKAIDEGAGIVHGIQRRF